MADPVRPSAQQVHDPRTLRALAHPVRNRILDEMSATGPVRAADIARDLDIPANVASFHLRQLAKYGLVEEAPDQGRDRRDRVWKLVAEHGLAIDLRDVRAAPGGPAAVRAWSGQAASRTHAIVDSAYRQVQDGDSVVQITGQTLRLSRDEAQQVAVELDQVLTGWADRTRGRDAGRRSYLVVQLLQPYPEGL